MIIGIAISFIIGLLFLYWIWTGITQGSKMEKEFREARKPDKQFYEKAKQLNLSLPLYSNRFVYPYIISPYFNEKLKAKAPEWIEDFESGSESINFRYKKNPRQGISESVLFEKLKSFLHEEKLFFGGKHLQGFCPDIIYADKKNKIFIDMEIDEPYSYEALKPLHYYKKNLDSKTLNGAFDTNEERDNVFKKYGWTVIRFSEEQVINETDSCVAIILQVIKYWSQDQYPFLGIKSVKEITKERRWTFDESLERIKLKSRDKYLLSMLSKRNLDFENDELKGRQIDDFNLPNFGPIQD